MMALFHSWHSVPTLSEKRQSKNSSLAAILLVSAGVKRVNLYSTRSNTIIQQMWRARTRFIAELFPLFFFNEEGINTMDGGAKI